MTNASLLQRVAAGLTRWSTRFVPDAFVIALLLSALVAGMALVLTPTSPSSLVMAWGNGLWQLLEFASQMCLVVMGGYVLAVAPPVRRALDWVASRPKTPRGAIALTAAVSMGLAMFNWGLSIVASAFFVIAVARQKIRVDHRLLCATGYLGLGCLWHAGLSASAPLLIATKGKYSEYFGVIPVTDTIFHPLNIGLVVVTFVVLTLLAAAMHPPEGAEVTAPPSALVNPEPLVDEQPEDTPAARLEHSRIPTLILAAISLGYVGARLVNGGLSALNINTVNLLMLSVGMALHPSVRAFLAAARGSADALWPIILQFPFYAGILGMIDGSGLDDILANGFTRISTPETFPLVVTWYSGILNYVVPSGGSKLAIEASYIAAASKQLGVPLNLTVIAYAWGDMLTDVIQPFWALPLLGAAKLGFRDIMGYCVVFFLVYGVIVTAGFGLLALGVF
ncbi:MAG: TIGR00366 family protein [Myxococcota bacterium]